MKKHLEKKMMKIEKKTEKAIMHIAREIIKEKAKKEQDNKWEGVSDCLWIVYILWRLAKMYR